MSGISKGGSWGSDLGGSTDSASRQSSPHPIPSIQLWQQFPLHSRGDVHYVTVTLHLHESFHVDRAHLGNLAHIIAAKIYKHDVL